MKNSHSNSYWWAMYDFANSISIIVFYVFYPLWFVKVRGGTDAYYNWTFILSSLLFLCTAPYLASRSDKRKSYLPDLELLTTVTAMLYVVTSVMALIPSIPLMFSFISFTLCFYFYQLTFVYYTPLLKYISASSSINHVSGLGQAANYFGQVAGLIIAFPFVAGFIKISSISPLALPYIPAVFVFVVLAQLSLKKLKPLHEEIITTSSTPSQNEKAIQPSTESESAFRILITDAKTLFIIPGVALFFVTYFLLSDAVLTLSTNFSLYLTSFFQTSSSAIIVITILILSSSAIGAYIFGKLSHRIGNYRSLQYIIIGWVGTLVLLLLSHNFYLSVLCFIIGGFFLGPVWGVSRAILLERVPSTQLGVASSLYTLSERLSTFIGPFIWATSLNAYQFLGNGKYKVGVFNLLLLIIFSGVLWLAYKKHSTQISTT